MLWFIALAHAADVDTALQARLLASSGEPIDGSVTVSVTLYDGSSGTTVVDGPRNLGTQVVTDGYFAATLPVDAAKLSAATSIWVEYTVGGTPLSPRQPLLAAARSATAEVTRGDVVIESTSLAACNPGTDPSSVGRLIRANGTLYTCESTGPVALMRQPNWNFCSFDTQLSYAVTGHQDHKDIDLECTITSTGRPIKVEYCLGFQVSGGTNGGTYAHLYQDGTNIVDPGYWVYNSPNDALHSNNCGMWVVQSPPVGTRTYEMRPFLHACGSCTYYLGQRHIFVTEL
jgi:hypothetical protein